MNARARQEAIRRSLLRELEEALFEALSESGDVHRSLVKLQQAGFVLRISIECADRQRDRETTSESPARRDEEASFRIDANDLRFLRSIGIDPTRKPRGRRPKR